MPTFTQAQTVEAGEPLKASQLASLAAAFNSRLLSGVGDMVWRIAYYLHSGLVRQLRNSDGAYTFPPDAEFWNIYQHVNPNDAEYPLTGPGDPEGANLANPINAFVYGTDGEGGDSENRRLANCPTRDEFPEPMTPSRYWRLGQYQRGAFDPNTGAVSWPAGDAAKAYAYIRHSLSSPHGNAYGGWIPYPTDDGGCINPEDTNYQLKFTRLDGTEVKTYTTNCPEDSGRVDVAYGPFAYIIFHGSGAIEILPKAEWIEGPYKDNATLSKTSSNALARVLNHYGSEFRGTVDQGAGVTNSNAFDLQRFLTTQYPLAPNIGSEMGGGYMSVQYPAWQSEEFGSPGTFMARTSGGATHVWRDGTVCHGMLVKSAKLLAPCSIEVIDGEEVVKRWDLPAGEFEELFILPTAKRLTDCKVVLRSDLDAAAGGGIFVEASEILEMKPQIHDYYLVTRLAFYSASIDRIDGRGIDCTVAREILENLYTFGCVTPAVAESGLAGPAADPVLNQNAVYDAARRFTKYCRIIPRWNLTGYALESGKSVLWFNRTAYGPAGFPDRDMWEGIGPSQELISDFPIKWGRQYKVIDGKVTYNGATYEVGKAFRGVQGVESFTGGGHVKEVDGIRREAEPADYSNRWALTLTLKPYHTSISSIWKTDAYGDVLTPFLNRCHIDSPEIDSSKQNRRHITYGQPSLVPESPSGLNYNRVRDSIVPGVTHVNKRNCAGDPDCEAANRAFYKSCRIFEPPLEIESAVMDGTQLKVTLTGRLHHHDSAPATIAKDTATWDLTVLRSTEDYRTHENGIREYLVWTTQGINASNKIGDWAINSGGPGGTDTPFGSVLPTFILCKLIPEPYLDQNDKKDAHDSLAIHDPLKQAELYLRAGCEGFVDGITSTSVACETGTVSAYDYTYENLMFQAVGNRWSPLLPLSVRPDNPFGFGPLPNTNFYADVFNALAKGVNLLTDARIMLPSEGEHRLIQGQASQAIPVADSCGSGVACSGLISGVFAVGNANLDASASTISGWVPGFINGAGFSIGLSPDSDSAVNCVGDRWKAIANRTNMQIRWVLTDPDSYYALPGNLGSLLDSDAVAAMGIDTSVTTAKLAYGTIGDAAGNASGFCGSRPAGTEYAYFATTTTTTTVCHGMQNTIVAPQIGGLVGIGKSGSDVMSGGPSSGSAPTVYEDGTAIVRIPQVPYTGGS